MSIFKNNETTKNSSFIILRKSDKFFITHQGWPYDLSPSNIVKINLPPNVEGVDSFLKKVSQVKNISGDVALETEKQWFFCDVRIEFKENFMNGYTYNIFGEEMSIPSGLGVWICPYIKFFYEDMPKKLYLKINSV